MDGIEKAIRDALEKGDAGDRAFREQVYRKAFGALDRALQKNPNVTVEAAIRRRNELKARVAEIEQEFLPAVEAGDPAMDSGPVVAAPNRDFEFAPEPGGEPHGVDAATRVVPARRSRGRFARIFVGSTLVAALAIGLWWAFDGGMFLTDAQRDTSVPNPPVALEEEDYVPSGSENAPATTATNTADRDWIAVFDPQDPTTATAAGDATASVIQEDADPHLVARSGPSGSAIVFDVGQGILDQIAGRKVVFVVDAGTDEGKRTQIAVDCNFGNLGDCGRKRYLIDRDRGDYLFEIDVPDGNAGAPGSIAVVSDVEGEGRAVDIYGIRVAISE